MRFGKFLSMSALLAAAAVFLSVANAQTLTNVTPLVNGCRGTAGTGTCSVCQGWCTLDSDCAGHLRCFHRNLLTPVPGCTCTSGNCGAVDWDYCYDPGVYYVTGSWNPPWTAPSNLNWNPPWNNANWSPPQNWNPSGTKAPTWHWNRHVPTWSPPWSHPNTQPTPSTATGSLKSKSASGCGSGGCRECEGDCDSDRDCSGNLECFQRDGLGAVPGCGSGGMEAWDYCIKKAGNQKSDNQSKETKMPTKKPASAPSTPIKNRGKDGCNDGKCKLCEGDCDRDSDCKKGLRCFLREGLEPVPGCSGDGHGAWDYCIADP